MRQTSRAVALLLALESANALTAQVPVATGKGGSYVTIFNPSDSATGASPTNSQQLNSRTAGYTGLTQVFAQTSLPTVAGTASTAVTGWTDATYSGGKVLDAGTVLVAAQPRGTALGSGCVQCIRGTGVWCSRSFAYLSSNNVFQAATSTIATNATVLPSTPAGVYGGISLDGGFCCDSKTNFNLFVGTKVAPTQVRAVNNNASSAGAAGIPMVQTACPAIVNASYVSTSPAAQEYGVSEIDNVTTQYSSWWCSNGLFKKVTVVTGAGQAVIVNANQTIASSENQRLELALVGCPQGTTMCNNGVDMAFNLTAIAPTKAYTMPVTAAGGMTMTNKCTWVVWSTMSGPTFTFGNGPALGLVGSNWEIHAMEYTAQGVSFDQSKGSLVASAQGGVMLVNEGLAAGNYTPHFTMPANQFATLRTWYGEGNLLIDPVTQQTSTWSSAGGAPIANDTNTSLQLAGVKSQLYGNVANVPVSGMVTQGTSTTTPLTATQNYGTYNNIRFDLRQMRFFPAKVAQTQHAAGTTAAAAYTSALTSYNTAKTTWDAYVAILEKNAKQDAFAALFSPPKAPTVPPLPNKPWLPAGYSGYTRATAQQVTGFTNAASVTTSAAPLASEVWTSLAAAQTVGGWGSFTAHILRFRNGWGKSFGTIGYDGTGTAMSDVWNYQWSCGTGSGAAVSAVYPGVNTTNQCAPVYSGTAGVALQPATSASPTNAVKMITVVSLWSTFMVAASTTNSDWTTNGFSITFTAGAWTSGVVGLTPIAAPTAAVAAKSLTGIAGAQALVASSAAALAVAAALY